MKKSNIIPQLVLLAGLAFSNLSFAQYSATPAINRNSLSESLKSDLNKEIANREAFENLKTINMKVFKNFSRYFSSASDIQTTIDDHSIMVNCEVQGVKTRVSYNKNGRWNSTLRTMNPEQLPVHLSDDILENYPGYKISRGNEVIVGPYSAYLIDIENEKSFKTVRVIDGEYDIYQEFLKQKNN